MKSVHSFLVLFFICLFASAQPQEKILFHAKTFPINKNKEIHGLDLMQKVRVSITNSNTSMVLKNAGLVKQKLDSAIYGDRDSNLGIIDYRDKYYLEYNSRGQLTLLTNYEKDESGNWTGYEKDEYKYDANGNLSEYIEYYWDTDVDGWLGDEKMEQAVDASGNIISTINYSWDDTSNDWIEDNKHESTFDGNGKMLVNTYYNWDEDTNSWKNSGKTEYAYNNDNNLTITNTHYWDSNSNEWVNSGKTEYTYDNNSNLILMTDSTKDYISGQLRASMKIEYAYNAAGLQIMEADYSWDLTTSQWIGDTKSVRTYDAQGNLTGNTSYKWDQEVSGNWIENGKIELTYNNDNLLTSLIQYDWDTISSQWIYNLKTELSVDAYGNHERITAWDWNLTTNQWEYSGKQEYIYNNSFTVDDLVLPFGAYYSDDFYDLGLIMFNHMILEESEFIYENEAWIKSTHARYYYSGIEISNSEIYQTGDLNVFPNPANEHITFQLSGNSEYLNILVYNTYGDIIFNGQFAEKITIQTSGLPDGLYFFNISDKNKNIKSGKFIIQ